MLLSEKKKNEWKEPSYVVRLSLKSVIYFKHVKYYCHIYSP